MIRIIKTLAVHIFCIILFSFFYFKFSTHFDNNKHDSSRHTLLDYVLFSTTIQAGVGLSDIFPKTVLGKILLVVQQLLMLSINVITIFVFTI